MNLFLLLMLWMGVAVPVGAASFPRSVRVRLFEAHPDALQSLTLQGTFELRQPARRRFPHGSYRVDNQGGRLRLAREAAGSPKLFSASRLVIEAPEGQILRLQAGDLPPRAYAGTLTIRPAGVNRLEIINTVPAQTYVAVVVGSETGPDWPVEALKAQAVLTQTGIARLHRDVLVGDSTQREVYLGLDHASPTVTQAVQSVWGEVLTWNGSPITPYYHASCAGHTGDGRAVFGKPLPYLSSVVCSYCRNARFSQPTRTSIPKAAFEKRFPGVLPEILSRDVAGYPLALRLGNGRSMRGYDFWLALGHSFGWDKAPGLRFSLTRQPEGNIQFTSTGAGHGLGLCQHGAGEMARRGRSYREILRFYFPKTHLLQNTVRPTPLKK